MIELNNLLPQFMVEEEADKINNIDIFIQVFDFMFTCE